MTPRAIGLAMFLWTAAVGAGFAFVAVGAAIPSVALTLAVGALFGAVWFIGLVILTLFLAVR